MESVGRQLNAGIEGLSFAELTAIGQLVDEAQGILVASEINPDTANGILMAIHSAKNTLTNTESTLLKGRNAIVAYMNAIGLGETTTGEPNNPFIPAGGQEDVRRRPHETGVIQEVTRAILDRIQSANTEHSRPVDEIIALLNSSQDHILENMLDPNHASATLGSLADILLHTEKLTVSSEQIRIRGVMSRILQSNDGRTLLSLAKQTENEALARLAEKVLFQSYSLYTFKKPPTEITDFLSREEVITRQLDTHSIPEDGFEIPTPGILLLNTPTERWPALLTTIDDAAASTRQARHMARVSSGKLMLDAHFRAKAKQQLSAIGLDYDELKQIWTRGLLRDESGLFSAAMYEGENIRKILTFEARHQGAAKQISETFGIKNFGRLGPETLETLYNTLQKPPEKYILFVMPETDKNGVLINAGEYLEYAIVNLPDEATPIVAVELNGVTHAREVKRKLQKIGLGQAESVIIAAHGNKDTVKLSFTDNPQSKPNQTGRFTSLTPLLRGIVKEGGTYSMISCATGKDDDNIAQYVANASGRSTYAPPERVRAGFFASVNETTGETEIDIRFTDNNNIPTQAIRFDPQTDKTTRL